MPSYTQPPYLLEEVRVEYCTEPDPGILAREAPAVYRPRHAEATVFYQTFEQHFEKYVAAYEERFEPRSGPLRHVSAGGGRAVPRVRPAPGRFCPPSLPFVPERTPGGFFTNS